MSSLNGLAYFWRAKHKQQIVFYLYFFVPCIRLWFWCCEKVKHDNAKEELTIK
jgi:hypothetical protein